jgi:phospholipase C
VPAAEVPHTDSDGNFDGTALCEATYTTQTPPVPYGNQTLEDSLFFEDGFKQVVGSLTEGRYLTFEIDGWALTNPFSDADGTGLISISQATSTHESENQRWVIHYSQGEQSGIFQISSALDGRFIGDFGLLVPASEQELAANFKITFLGNGGGYTVQYVGGNFLTALGDGILDFAASTAGAFQIYSVSYHSS